MTTKATVNIGSVTMPPGTYYVGDPCYAVPDARWEEWLEAADYRNQQQYLIAEIDGHPVLGINTAFGDGTYFDELGREYPVDAGLIGVTPAAFTDAHPSPTVTTVSTGVKENGIWLEGLHRITFDVPFECRYDKDTGDIWIGLIRIETDLEGDD